MSRCALGRSAIWMGTSGGSSYTHAVTLRLDQNGSTSSVIGKEKNLPTISPGVPNIRGAKCAKSNSHPPRTTS
ncbi:hypothetical protein DPMN_042166 [Dreissena polymorpha]|uniref:Uncharacterized protein n=1 Tax=Dreissena polymorpha TaxID=45954 RepID=A0A9D4CY47_DREPO|nr:hypothetical protein DPMN_042166 [Dreissena polymorpha]